MARKSVLPWVGVIIALAALATIGCIYWNWFKPQGGDMALSKEEYQKRTQMRMQYQEPPYKPGGQLIPSATARPSLDKSPLEAGGR